MKVIRSHWRLAYRTFIKAIKVTFSEIGNNWRSHKFSIKVYDDLYEQRNTYKKLEKVYGIEDAVNESN